MRIKPARGITLIDQLVVICLSPSCSIVVNKCKIKMLRRLK